MIGKRLPPLPPQEKMKTNCSSPLSLTSSCAPRALCSPTPRPHCPLLLPPLQPVGLPFCRRPLSLRKSSVALLHRSSASSSAILVRSLVRSRPGAFWSSLERWPSSRGFCWLFHCGKFLKRCLRVWVLYWHRQHLASGLLVVHWRCYPVRQCP